MNTSSAASTAVFGRINSVGLLRLALELGAAVSGANGVAFPVAAPLLHRNRPTMTCEVMAGRRPVSAEQSRRAVSR